MKIVVLDARPLASDRQSWQELERFGELVVHDHSTAEEMLVRAADAQIIMVNKTEITWESLNRLPELRFIAVSATGFDCVDVDAARKRGIPVSNVPEYGTDSVAQFVFALLLELCQHVALHDQAVRAGEWSSQPDFSLRKTPLVELAGKTLGVVGYGRIGRRVTALARAFGMEVLVASHSRSAAGKNDPHVVDCDLDGLFVRADVITLHCPLTDQTEHLVNQHRLSLVRPGAFLINTARGALIDEQALARALNKGKLAGAALDVVSTEPIQPDNPLLKARNCLITPHIAWATTEARQRLLDASIANVESFVNGSPINVVN